MDDTDKREQEQAEFEATEAKRRRKVKAKASVPSDLDTVRAKAGAGDAVTAGTAEGVRKSWVKRHQLHPTQIAYAHAKAEYDAIKQRVNEDKAKAGLLGESLSRSTTDAQLEERVAKEVAIEHQHGLWESNDRLRKAENEMIGAAKAHMERQPIYVNSSKKEDLKKVWEKGPMSISIRPRLVDAAFRLDHSEGVQSSDATVPDDNAVHCRAEASVALSAAEPWKQDEPVRFIYAPAGVHTITAGFRDGRITMTVVVDEETPSALQASFKAVAGRRSQTPFADEEHEAHKATLRFPKDGTEFGWGTLKDSTGVVLAGGLPTSYGAEAVNGRTYESWSPEFLTDADYAKARVSEDGHYTFPNGVRGSASNPARLVGVGFTIGALTNKPAFHMMPPVKAGDAAKATDGEVKAASPGLGFCKLAGLAAGLQVAHWAADTVTNAHKAIGDLYETVSAKVDEFAEVYSGKTGEVPLSGESCEVKAVGDHTELVEQGLATVEEVRGVLGGGDDDLLNILADIEAAYNKARYLLKATEGSGTVVLADKGRGDTVTASTILESLSGRRSEAVLAKLRGEAEPPKPPPTSEEILARLGQTGARPNN